MSHYTFNLFGCQEKSSEYNGIFHAYNRMGFGSEIETVLEPALQRTFRRGIKSRFYLD